MEQLNYEQLQMFCEKHDLTIHECARLIGISTQTLYNAFDGKPVKAETQRKIDHWLTHLHREHHEWSLSGGIETLDHAFRAYREAIHKEWQRNMPRMSYEDQLAFLEALRQLDANYEQLSRHHELFLRVLAESNHADRQSG